MYTILLLLASFSVVAAFTQQGKVFVNARTGASELKMVKNHVEAKQYFKTKAVFTT